MAVTNFLSVPLDVRNIIYDIVFNDHRCSIWRRKLELKAISNGHIRILLTCKQIYAEAAPIFYRLVSLRSEWQWTRFARGVPAELASIVESAVVANDGRFTSNERLGVVNEPTTELHAALRMMKKLKHLMALNFYSPRKGCELNMIRVCHFDLSTDLSALL